MPAVDPLKPAYAYAAMLALAASLMCCGVILFQAGQMQERMARNEDLLKRCETQIQVNTVQYNKVQATLEVMKDDRWPVQATNMPRRSESGGRLIRKDNGDSPVRPSGD